MPEVEEVLVGIAHERLSSVVVRTRRIEVRDRIRRPVDESARRRRRECGHPCPRSESDDGKRDHGAERNDPPAHRSSFHVVPFLLPVNGSDRSEPLERYDAKRCRKVGANDGLAPGGVRSSTPTQPGSLRDSSAELAAQLPSFERMGVLDLKTDARGADTGHVDAAERREILNRYRDHSRRFEAAAARRSSSRRGAVIPFTPPASREVGQDPTAREIEVLQLVADGLVNREIGERLFLSEETVKSHVRHLLAKLQVKKSSPRRSGWLPAWAHLRNSSVCIPISIRAVPHGLPPKEGCPPSVENRGCDGSPDLRTPGHRQ